MKVVIRSHMLSSDESKEDTLIWGLTNNGLFSTSTAYRHIKEANENHRHETSERFKWIWSAKAPNKIKTFLWLIYHMRQPTNHSLNHRGLDVDPKYHYYDNDTEDINHIFFQCPNSLTFWNHMTSTSNNLASIRANPINATN